MLWVILWYWTCSKWEENSIFYKDDQTIWCTITCLESGRFNCTSCANVCNHEACLCHGHISFRGREIGIKNMKNSQWRAWPDTDGDRDECGEGCTIGGHRSFTETQKHWRWLTSEKLRLLDSDISSICKGPNFNTQQACRMVHAGDNPEQGSRRKWRHILISNTSCRIKRNKEQRNMEIAKKQTSTNLVLGCRYLKQVRHALLEFL